MADMDNVFSAAPILEESISATTLTNSVDLGTRVTWKGEDYVYCYNAGGAAIAPKLAVKIVTGASGFSVAATSLANVANICVGVVKHTTFAAAAYGWVMTRGFAIVTNGLASSTITGDYIALALGAAGGFVNVIPPTDAVAVGTYAIAAYGIGVNVASAGTFYAAIRTGF